MKIRRSTLKDRVTVRTRTGEGSYGDVFAEALDVPCYLDETRRLVRDASGQQAVSEATLTLHPDSRATLRAEPHTPSVVDPLEVFTPESEVDLGGRLSRVITARRITMRGYVVSIEVTCS